MKDRKIENRTVEVIGASGCGEEQSKGHARKCKVKIQSETRKTSKRERRGRGTFQCVTKRILSSGKLVRPRPEVEKMEINPEVGQQEREDPKYVETQSR